MLALILNIGYFIELVTTNNGWWTSPAIFEINYTSGINTAIQRIENPVMKMRKIQNIAALQRVLCILPQHVSGAQTHSQHDILQHELLQS